MNKKSPRSKGCSSRALPAKCPPKGPRPIHAGLRGLEIHLTLLQQHPKMQQHLPSTGRLSYQGWATSQGREVGLKQHRPLGRSSPLPIPMMLAIR